MRVCVHVSACVCVGACMCGVCFNISFIPCGNFRLPYLGKATAAAANVWDCGC